MKRLTALVLAFALLGGPLAAGQTIQWISNARQGVAKAQARGLPVLFYVRGKASDDDSSIVRDQRRAFRDPRVVRLVRERFVPVRLANSNETRALLRDLGAPVQSDQLVVATPGGKYLGRIGTDNSRNANSLLQGLQDLFNTYRGEVFRSRVAKTLSNEDAKPAELMRALDLVQGLTITQADELVARLLDRPRLSSRLRKRVYDTLAHLSTRRAVEKLLEVAPLDKLAGKALARCTPEGATYMLDALDPGKLELHVIAYEAVTKICKIKKTRPRGFWKSADADTQMREIARVREQVQRVAKRWKERYGKWR